MKYPLALVAAVAFTLTAQAQEQGWTGHTPPTPAQSARHEVSRYTTLLSLNSDQEAQATTMFTEEAASGQAMRTSERTAHQALETAIKGNDTAAIQQAATALGQLEGERMALHSTTQAKFYAGLTAEQKTKYAALEHGHRGGPEHGPDGGPGGPPPPAE